MNKNIVKISIILLTFLRSYAEIPEHVIKNMKFWGKQIEEHAEFASDFTDNAKLKNEGLHLALKMREFNQNINKNTNPVNEFLDLCKEMKTYQNQVRTFLKKQPNTYKDRALSLDLLDHMDLETDYAQKKAQNKKLSKQEEVEFWSKEHKGEAHVISVLMTPAGAPLKEKAEEVETELKKNARYSLGTVEEANSQLNAIAQKLDADPSKTMVPKKLAAHEKRERERAAQTFRELEKKR